MLENILMTGFALMLIGGSFLIGYFVGLSDALNVMEEPEELYCFQCETDMPVKEKKGDFYCNKCGLYHGTKI